ALLAGKGEVTFDPAAVTAEAVRAAIEDAGYEATVLEVKRVRAAAAAHGSTASSAATLVLALTPAVELAALGAPFLAGAAALDRARAALDEVGVGHLADRGVAEMSGGERARVLLARALTVPAPLLVADEPIAGLDPDAQLLVLERLRARAEAGRGVLVSLHDLTLAARFADRVVVLDQGRTVADGAPTEALSPRVLKTVFSLDAVWLEALDGPLLAARRLSSP
ncbi:MAG: ATP-binding cassette domain-containing protein, partial [Bordetella sp.]|nr:ATP-binding cassette domain-containing protein [Bordetella sp.]